jgi:hypothetical protein
MRSKTCDNKAIGVFTAIGIEHMKYGKYVANRSTKMVMPSIARQGKTSSAPAFLGPGYRPAALAHLHIDVRERSNERCELEHLV